MKKIGTFTIDKVCGAARRGSVVTKHGIYETPAFMAVGTQATVKGMTPRDLHDVGSQIILSNTYHLHIRPGDEVIRDLGGLHRFMGWDGPILTDSGGYQVFSLSKLRKLSDHGVEFQSHVDGAPVLFTPEKVVGIQENLGVDIMMVLDECLPYPATEAAAEESLRITTAWARRAADARRNPEQLAFGIMQGGMYPQLRTRAAEALREIGFDGYAIGGLSVGEPSSLMYEMAELSASLLPSDKVRYLMGVGTPSDIVKAVSVGVDQFDCVIPTRSARFGRLFCGDSHINIRNAEYRNDQSPIEEGCDCYTCRTFSRAYLSHLIHAKEVLAVHLATLHNLRFYQRLMSEIRAQITAGTFGEFAKSYLARRVEAGQTSGGGEE